LDELLFFFLFLLKVSITKNSNFLNLQVFFPPGRFFVLIKSLPQYIGKIRWKIAYKAKVQA